MQYDFELLYSPLNPRRARVQEFIRKNEWLTIILLSDPRTRFMQIHEGLVISN